MYNLIDIKPILHFQRDFGHFFAKGGAKRHKKLGNAKRK